MRRTTGMRPGHDMGLKAVELAWRRFWIAALTRSMSITARRLTPRGLRGVGDAGLHPERVLFLRPDRIGDMIVTTGVLRAIAGSHPGMTLDVLASPANASVIRHESWLGQVHVLRRRSVVDMARLLARLRAARYDVVVDCMPTAPSLTTLMLMLASGARERVGVAGRGHDDAFTVAVPPRADARHIIDHLSTLAAPFGIDVASADFTPVLTLCADERARADALWREAANGATPRRRLLVNVSAGTAPRRWPDSRFVELLDLLARRAPDVCAIVIGAPDEAERVAAIAAAAGVARVRTDTIRDAMALVGSADVVVSPDTSIAHAAAAFRRPTVVLHLRGSAVEWGLYGAPGCVIESEDRTLASIPVLRVWRALDVLLHPASRPELADAPRRRGDADRVRRAEPDPRA